MLTKIEVSRPIAELIELSQQDIGSVRNSLSSEAIHYLCNEYNIKAEFAKFYSNSCLLNIISTVTTIILKWALQLEADGIMGNGLTFSLKEKDIATNIHYITNIFYESHN